MSNLLLIDLPVEILHRIFDELDAHTIVSSVRAVCTQLRYAANSYNRFKLTFRSAEKSRLKFLSCFIQPSNVYSVDLVRQRFDQGCVRFFLNNFNINHFSQLRSMTIDGGNQTELTQLLSQIRTDFMFSLTINALIFTNEFFTLVLQLLVKTNLRKLVLSKFTYNTTAIAWPSQNTLEQLTIAGCSYHGYQLILQNSHGLRQLTIKKGSMSDVSETVSSYVTAGPDSAKRQRFSTNSSVLDSRLTSLTIDQCRISTQNLECYLSFTRTLAHLKLILFRSTLDSLFDGSYWQQIIQNNLPLLIKLELCFTCSETEFNGESSFESLILSFQSPFWLKDKKWFVACDYIPQYSQLRLYTIPACVEMATKCTTLKVSSLDSKYHCRLGQNEQKVVRHGSETFAELSLISSNIKDNMIKCIALALLEQIALKTLDLSHNQIEDLGALQLAEALQKHQTLVSLNLSHNRIGNDGAKLLYHTLKDNKTLTNLDLAGNPGKHCAFVSLEFKLRSHKGLIQIKMNSKGISDDDVTFLSEILLNKNVKLHTFDLSDNQIGPIGTQQLADALRNNQTLCKLNLANNKITNIGIQYLYDVLKENQALQELELSNNPGSYCVAVSASFAIRCNRKNTRMNLSGKSIGDDGIKFISEALPNNRTVTKLDISKNEISDVGAKYISDALRHNQTLTSLVLGVSNEKKEEYSYFSYGSKSSSQSNCENRIGEDGAKYFADVLETNKTLTNLDFSGNRIGDVGVKYIADSLQKNQSIKELILANQYVNYRIGDLGAQHLADALQRNISLTTLNLSSNQIGDIGARYLTDALRNNQTLITLNLEENLIENSALEYFHNTLKDNQTLEELKLDGNPGSYCTAVSAAIQIRNNQKITTISLCGNTLDDVSIKFVSEALITNQTIIELNTWSNKLSDIGIQTLCDALQNNSTIISMNFSGIQFSDNGVKYLADVLKNNKTLIKLIISNSNFNDKYRVTDAGARYLGEALKTNKTLQELKLSMNPRGYCAVVEAVVESRNKNNTTIDLGGYQIKNDELQYLVGELKYNQTLTALNLQGNSFGQNEARYIADFLRINKVLTELNLSCNELRDAGIQYLANAMCNNTTLTTLILEETKIGRFGAEHLANALRNNRILLTLNIKSNHIQDIGAQCFASALRNNQTLEVLKVGDNKISYKLRNQLISEDKRWCFTLERRYSSDQDEHFYYESD